MSGRQIDMRIKQEAERLFIIEDKSCQQVANQLDISRRTVCRWIHKGFWRLKRMKRGDILQQSKTIVEKKVREFSTLIDGTDVSDEHFIINMRDYTRLVEMLIKLDRMYYAEIMRETIRVMDLFAGYLSEKKLSEQQSSMITGYVDGFFVFVKEIKIRKK